MRISGGSAKGRRTATKKQLLGSPRKGRIRPTRAKVREALFDILRHSIGGSTFVDLYAGTGTVGLESLSRGAVRAVFIEPDPVMTEIIKRNAQEFGFSERAYFFPGRADEFLQRAASAHEHYDILFLDPPYHSDELERILPVIGRTDVLSTDGVVVVEHYFKKKLPDQFGFLRMQKCYRYGDTVLTFYKRALA